MTVAGFSKVIRYEKGKNARIRKDPKEKYVTGYTDMGEQKLVFLDRKKYIKTLQKYTKLFFEGFEIDEEVSFLL